MPIPREPAFPLAEYEQRLARVQHAMAAREFDVMLLFSPHNIFWMTGMDSENLFDYQCLAVRASGDPVLLIFDFEMARFENSAAIRNVRTYSAFDDPIRATMGLLREMKASAGTVGLELRTRNLSVDYFERLRADLRGAHAEDCFGVVENCRLVKSQAEIACMRRAAELTDAGVLAGFQAMAPGKRDSEVGAAIVNAMYREGSDTACWGPIVAAGYRSGAAHSTFNGYRLREGDTVFLELTGEIRRYTAPLMRTAILGRPPDEIRRLADIVEGTVELIVAESRAGVKAADVATRALARIEPVLGDVVFHHYFGYPVGIGYPPSWIEQLGYFLRVDTERPLEAGMVFHLPISLRKYGQYAVNLSQTMLVNEDGAEPLGRSPARLEVIAA